MTAQIAIGATVLPIIVAALAAYAFAWLEFPGRDWLFIVVIALLVVPLQMALIPIFSLYNTLGLYDTVLGPRPLPHGLRAAVRDLPAPELLHRDPEGHARVGAHRRRVRDPDLLAPDPAARAAGDRLARDLPVPLDVERPDRRAHVRPQHAADHGRDLHASSREFGSNIEIIAPAAFVSLAMPLVVFFAFQRYFVQGLLAGSVKWTVSERCAIVGGGLAGFVAYATLRHGGLEPGEIAVFGTDADPAAAWRPRADAIRQRADALGERRPLLAALLSRARGRARRCGASSLVPLARDRAATATARRVASSSSTSQSCAGAAAGTRASCDGASSSVRAVGGGFDVDGRGVFQHVLLAPGHPGLALPRELEGDARAVHAYEPHEYASTSCGRRRRHGRGDRVAERARRRRRSRLGAPARACATSAQPSPAALLQARLVVVPRDEPGRARRAATPPRAPSYPPGRDVGRAAGARPARGPFPGRAVR